MHLCDVTKHAAMIDRGRVCVHKRVRVVQFKATLCMASEDFDSFFGSWFGFALPASELLRALSI